MSATRETGVRSITVARGDGIGPEIMEATLTILEAAGVDATPEERKSWGIIEID